MNKSRTLLVVISVLISTTIPACNKSVAGDPTNDNRMSLPSVRLSSTAPSSQKSLTRAANSRGHYFVAPDGLDSNAGTIARPFRTVQKCADVVKLGETCFLRAGIYRETIRPKSSGRATLPITFTAYNNEDVTISGANPVEGWAEFQNSIFRTNVILPVSSYENTGFLANQVFVNGEMMPEARWPNVGPDLMHMKLTGCCVKSLGGTAAIVENSEIPTLPEGWAGATVWTNEWYVSRTGTITSGTAGKLKAEMTAAWDRGGFWFYLVGKLGLLDSEGEWFYDGVNRMLYLWGPGGKHPSLVEVKQRNFAFDLSDRSYIVLHNLKLFANTISTSDASSGIVIDRIRAKYVSHHMTLPPLPLSEQAPGSDNGLIVSSHAHDTGIQLRGNGHTLKNSIIEWSSGNGVLLEGSGHTVTNNIIANSNYMVSYAAPVRINGTAHRITHNTLVGAGRDAIAIDWHTAGFDARNIEIAYNDISGFGTLSTDLGAIYICCYINLDGGSIHHNWIHDAQAFSPFWGTRGIYLDLESYNSTIHHNVVSNIMGGKDSFYLAAGSPRGYNRVFNNTFLGPVSIDKSVEARNNIFATASTVTAQQSHNLFIDIEANFKSAASEPKTPNFNLQLNSAINTGRKIPGITERFVGSAPDIGAYEQGGATWQVGSNLER